MCFCRSEPYPCVSDEHYYPTVLAAAGFSDETTCAGNAMHVDWARAPGNGSPFTYWMKVRRPQATGKNNLSVFGHVPAACGSCASGSRQPPHLLDKDVRRWK